ncbi:Disco-interacting protein 2 C [Fasciola gigantica]|uniref:Disco-interacting protein 2 C n=1 Tax=Fasciola gigantica TaxID=46835 RepID=A0A504Z3K8_FASGI|nr:Disco-interacting protein 2 C [Fasciola gigantica]
MELSRTFIAHPWHHSPLVDPPGLNLTPDIREEAVKEALARNGRQRQDALLPNKRRDTARLTASQQTGRHNEQATDDSEDDLSSEASVPGSQSSGTNHRHHLTDSRTPLSSTPAMSFTETEQALGPQSSSHAHPAAHLESVTSRSYVNPMDRYDQIHSSNSDSHLGESLHLELNLIKTGTRLCRC